MHCACIALALALIAMQQNARIDSEPILAFLCIAFLRLVTKHYKFMKIFALCKLDAMQCMRTCITYCEPALTVISSKLQSICEHQHAVDQTSWKSCRVSTVIQVTIILVRMVYHIIVGNKGFNVCG